MTDNISICTHSTCLITALVIYNRLRKRHCRMWITYSYFHFTVLIRYRHFLVQYDWQDLRPFWNKYGRKIPFLYNIFSIFPPFRGKLRSVKCQVL